MALAKANKQGKPTRDKLGRPSPLEAIEISELIEIMLKYARGGKFLYEMPGILYIEKGIMTSHDALDRIQDQDFRVARNIAKSLCISFWTERMSDASAPTQAWKFIMSNIAGWSEKKDVKHDGAILNLNHEADKTELDKFKETLKESGK